MDKSVEKKETPNLDNPVTRRARYDKICADLWFESQSTRIDESFKSESKEEFESEDKGIDRSFKSESKEGVGYEVVPWKPSAVITQMAEAYVEKYKKVDIIHVPVTWTKDITEFGHLTRKKNAEEALKKREEDEKKKKREEEKKKREEEEQALKKREEELKQIGRELALKKRVEEEKRREREEEKRKRDEAAAKRKKGLDLWRETPKSMFNRQKVTKARLELDLKNIQDARAEKMRQNIPDAYNSSDNDSSEDPVAEGLRSNCGNATCTPVDQVIITKDTDTPLPKQNQTDQ